MPHQLILSANIDGWRAFMARRHQKGFQKAAPKIWQRDHYRCQFCGFQSKRFQEIVNVDGNYQNNKASNLATACGLCAHGLFLGAPGLGHHMILLPQISQVQISHITRVLFCAQESDSQFTETAKSLYRNLRKFTEPLEEIFGKDSSSAEVFGQCLLDTYDIESDKYFEVMKKVRMLPNPKTFGKPIEFWSKSIMPALLSGELSMPGGGV